MRECVVADDDEVTRELAVLFAAEAGYSAVAVASGEEALELLRGRQVHAVLVDLQMPGLSGAALARALRAVCGPHTRLLAISASAARVGAEFDGFLRKPFSVAQLEAALEGRPVLSEATYASLADSMPRAQLLELYTMCLDDADRRIGLMRTMIAEGDRDGFERAAHAIKGGCGMVGALELAALAEGMEQQGGAPGALDEFLLASARLRRILAAQTESTDPVSGRSTESTWSFPA